MYPKIGNLMSSARISVYKLFIITGLPILFGLIISFFFLKSPILLIVFLLILSIFPLLNFVNNLYKIEFLNKLLEKFIIFFTKTDAIKIFLIIFRYLHFKSSNLIFLAIIIGVNIFVIFYACLARYLYYLNMTQDIIPPNYYLLFFVLSIPFCIRTLLNFSNFICFLLLERDPTYLLFYIPEAIIFFGEGADSGGYTSGGGLFTKDGKLIIMSKIKVTPSTPPPPSPIKTPKTFLNPFSRLNFMKGSNLLVNFGILIVAGGSLYIYKGTLTELALANDLKMVEMGFATINDIKEKYPSRFK